MWIKLNSSSGWNTWLTFLLAGLILSVALFTVPHGYCDDVDMSTARRVAESTLQRHTALYGDWNGASTPTVSSGRAISYNGTAVAYNFKSHPAGMCWSPLKMP